ncbi:hypothetical protein ACWEKM_31205 [Streptomyces sp. NPDC004752]
MSRSPHTSPYVPGREPPQNAMDAIIARRAEQLGAPGRVQLHADGHALRVDEPGVGPADDGDESGDGVFEVRFADFEGPFDG